MCDQKKTFCDFAQLKKEYVAILLDLDDLRDFARPGSGIANEFANVCCDYIWPMKNVLTKSDQRNTFRFSSKKNFPAEKDFNRYNWFRLCSNFGFFDREAFQIKKVISNVFDIWKKFSTQFNPVVLRRFFLVFLKVCLFV